MAYQGYIEDEHHRTVTKEGIKEWVQEHMSEAKDIALYCNVPSKAKIEEIYNRCTPPSCTDKAQRLADFKQECILARINKKHFDMGTIGGKKKSNRMRRKKTKRRRTVTLHK